MKKINIVVGVHSTRYGDTVYVSPITKGETMGTIEAKMMKEADFDPDYVESHPYLEEYFTTVADTIVFDEADIQDIEDI